MTTATMKSTRDQKTIRRWVQERDGVPATATGEGADNQPGVLRIHFPTGGTSDVLTRISWDDWLARFRAEGWTFRYDPDPKSRDHELIAE